MGKKWVQGSFVGSLRLCWRLRFLRMTAWERDCDGPAEAGPFQNRRVGIAASLQAIMQNTRSLHCASLRSG